jgi:hypothetical protein
LISKPPWRRSLQYEHFIRSEDLDELELHVRDQVADLVSQGHHEAGAFRLAMEAMGPTAETKAAYRKVHLGKLKREHDRDQNAATKAPVTALIRDRALSHRADSQPSVGDVSQAQHAIAVGPTVWEPDLSRPVMEESHLL